MTFRIASLLALLLASAAHATPADPYPPTQAPRLAKMSAFGRTRVRAD